MPEVDLTYSFESGLDGWTPAGIDLGEAAAWVIESSGESASTGARAVRFALQNAGGGPKIWMERGFSVTPGQSYDVSISLDLAASGAGEGWRMLAGAHAQAPSTAADLTVQDAVTPTATPQWEERSYTVRATANPEGELVVAIGFWATSVGSRTHYVDNVRLRFTQAGP